MSVVPSISSPRSCRIYTPYRLAAAMVRRTGDDAKSLWLEPCFGRGVFLRALHSAGIPKRRIFAVDLDNRPSKQDSLANSLRGVDFLEWCLTTNNRFSKILGNPPYFSLRHAAPCIQDAAAELASRLGFRLKRTGNCWVAFVCGALRVLTRGGDLCFVLPAAWDYADYAREIRSFLPTQFESLEVHRSARPLFPGVQDGTVVLVGRNFGGQAKESRRYEHVDGTALISHLDIAEIRKPSSIVPTAETNWNSKDKLPRVALGDLCEVRIGCVTGDCDYFLMNEDRRKSLGLPIASVIPVLSRARHLLKPRTNRGDWQNLRDNGERVWMFRPSERVLNHPAVKKYLDLKFSDGGCRRSRYKIRQRKTWYLTPLSGRIDGYLSGMCAKSVWVSLSGKPQVEATNTLYTLRFKQGLTLNEKAGICLGLLTTPAISQMRVSGRRYADGLIKYEPADIAAVRVPVLKDSRGAFGTYRRAIKLLLGGKQEEAIALVDRFVVEASRPPAVFAQARAS